MLKNKLVKGMLVSSTMVSLFAVAPIHAAEISGESTATYQAGYVGPTDPVAPGTEETDPNNWMVKYPKTIVLSDSNLVAEGDYATEGSKKGVELSFEVKQKVAGNDGDTAVTTGNVGNGIKVTVDAKDASKWTGKEITMDPTTGNGLAKMGIGNADALQEKGGKIDFITLTAANATNTDARAVLLDNKGAVDGTTYQTTLVFKFERQN